MSRSAQNWSYSTGKRKPSRLPGSEEGNAQGIFWFLRWGEPGIALNRLYHDKAPSIVMDVTEIERPGAKSIEYVGRLKDGKTRSFVEPYGRRCRC